MREADHALEKAGMLNHHARMLSSEAIHKPKADNIGLSTPAPSPVGKNYNLRAEAIGRHTVSARSARIFEVGVGEDS